MQITQSLHHAVARQPGAVATICGGRRHTFVQFNDRVARLAGALQDLGVEKGDRVGILSLNSDRYVEYYMAVPWAGAATNPVNTRWSATEIAYSLDDCDTKVLLIDDPFLPLLPELRRQSKSLRTLIHVGDGPTPEGLLSYEALIADTLPVLDARRGGTDLAGVFYTGGTTGFPKGVMLSHDGQCLTGLSMAAEGIARKGDRGLHAAPMFRRDAAQRHVGRRCDARGPAGVHAARHAAGRRARADQYDHSRADHDPNDGRPPGGAEARSFRATLAPVRRLAHQ
jgi:acyl-CoA synthetase (AMP-forming)/AMP-acid ligase II